MERRSWRSDDILYTSVVYDYVDIVFKPFHCIFPTSQGAALRCLVSGYDRSISFVMTVEWKSGKSDTYC